MAPSKLSKSSKSSKSKQPPASSLPSHFLHLSTLQLVTRSSPFTHAHTTALHTLSDLLGSYLSLLALAAKENAELGGRKLVSVWDVGRALEEFGGAGFSELRGECERGRGGGGLEGMQLRELAGGLRESQGKQAVTAPLARLTFEPLTSEELDYLQIKEEELQEAPDDGDEDDEEDAAGSSPPTSDGETMAMVAVKLEENEDAVMNEAGENDDGEEEDDDDEGQRVPASRWRSTSLIPSYVPDFLPPFPGMERVATGAASEPGRRKREREQARDAAAEAWAGANSATTSDPWIDIIPYAASTIAQTNALPVLPPLSPPASPASGRTRRRRSISPPPTSRSSSLMSYHSELPYILTVAPTYATRNSKRRLAASTLSLTALAPSGDTLFGSVPIDGTRSAALSAGFYPDDVPFTAIHPYNTSLPRTISRPIPAHPAPHSSFLAAPPAPSQARIPSIVPTLVKSLGGPLSSDLQLFSRLTRMGPPGSLSAAGKPLGYTFVGESGMVDSGVEWRRRFHNARLPKKESGSGLASAGGAENSGIEGSFTAIKEFPSNISAASRIGDEEKTGIKLNLKRAMNSVVGTPAADEQVDPSLSASHGDHRLGDSTTGSSESAGFAVAKMGSLANGEETQASMMMIDQLFPAASSASSATIWDPTSTFASTGMGTVGLGMDTSMNIVGSTSALTLDAGIGMGMSIDPSLAASLEYYTFDSLSKGAPMVDYASLLRLLPSDSQQQQLSSISPSTSVPFPLPLPLSLPLDLSQSLPLPLSDPLIDELSIDLLNELALLPSTTSTATSLSQPLLFDPFSYSTASELPQLPGVDNVGSLVSSPSSTPMDSTVVTAMSSTSQLNGTDQPLHQIGIANDGLPLEQSASDPPMAFSARPAIVDVVSAPIGAASALPLDLAPSTSILPLFDPALVASSLVAETTDLSLGVFVNEETESLTSVAVDGSVANGKEMGDEELLTDDADALLPSIDTPGSPALTGVE